MYIEYKTEKGNFIFVKVPGDSVNYSLDFLDGFGYGLISSNDNYQYTFESIKVDNWQLIGTTRDVTEEQAKNMVKKLGRGDSFRDYYNHLGNAKATAKESFSTIIKLLKINEKDNKCFVLFKMENNENS